jgi:hypothetical protein
MSIQHMTTTELFQLCTGCGAEHTISLRRGAQKTKRGPFGLEEGSTLELAVDTAASVTVTFGAADAKQLHAASAEEVARKLGAIVPALDAREDFGGCLLESRTEAPTSRIMIRGGSACKALGLSTTTDDTHSGRPPMLGIAISGFRDANTIVLRPCPCGVNEVLVRNFDKAPEHVAGSFFDQHRRAVNTLAEFLKRGGSSHPELAVLHAGETASPPDLFATGPAGELAIDLKQSRLDVGDGE